MAENSTLQGNTVAASEVSKEPTNAEANPKSPLIEKIRALRHRLPLVVRLPLAIFFLALGIIGGFIPVLQGWVFVLAAFWLIFPDQAEQLIEKIRAKFQKFKKKS